LLLRTTQTSALTDAYRLSMSDAIATRPSNDDVPPTFMITFATGFGENVRTPVITPVNHTFTTFRQLSTTDVIVV